MFGFDNRIIWIILIVMMIFGLGSLLSSPGALLNLVLTIPGFLIAIAFHEFAHAYIADKLGDDTPRRQGRLTLNPITHLDPVGSFLLLFAGFGWGKPVQINPRNFDRKMSMSKGEALVSLAGPVMNFILAFVFLIVMYIVRATHILDSLDSNISYIIWTILSLIIGVNVSLGVFNLIPLPPLDGSKILMHFLPYNAKRVFIEKSQWFYIGFVILFVTGLSAVIIRPIINETLYGMNWIIGSIFNWLGLLG